MTDDARTPDQLRSVLHEIARVVGLDPRGAELIKFTNNAVFRLPCSHAVVRIAGSPAIEARVPKIIQVARWLAEHDAPAVRLWPQLAQPITVQGRLATVWELVPAIGPAPTGHDLGRLLRLWHKLPAPDWDLPPWNPFPAIRRRLADPTPLREDERRFLLRRCDEIESELAEVRFALIPGPIWGDAFLGNLIPGPNGPTACDFDGSAHGPREWDLTPVAVGALRFRYPGDDQRALGVTYGFDVTNWEGFPVLRRVRELQLVTSVIPVLEVNPGLGAQWRHRFETFRSGAAGAKWSPYR